MFDTLIRNGLLVDGTGKAPFRGTLALRNAKIAAILPPDSPASSARAPSVSTARNSPSI